MRVFGLNGSHMKCRSDTNVVRYRRSFCIEIWMSPSKLDVIELNKIIASRYIEIISFPTSGWETPGTPLSA